MTTNITFHFFLSQEIAYLRIYFFRCNLNDGFYSRRFHAVSLGSFCCRLTDFTSCVIFIIIIIIKSMLEFKEKSFPPVYFVPVICLFICSRIIFVFFFLLMFGKKNTKSPANKLPITRGHEMLYRHRCRHRTYLLT